MRHLRSIGLAAVALFLLAACSDLPTMNAPTPDLAATFQVQAECGTKDNPCLLPPVGSDPVDPEPGCPWCYSGPCEESLPGSPEAVGAEGCNTGGPTGPSPDPGSGGPGGPGPGTGEEPTEPQQPEPCATGDAKVDAPGVFSGFADLWARSVKNGIEQGAWIVQEGSSFRLVPFQNAEFSACELVINEAPPASTVAMVHTHPWPLFSVTPCGTLNTGTPSDEDRAALQALGLSTGYLLDGGGIGRYTATDVDQADRLGRCGY